MMQYIAREGGHWRPLRHPISEAKIRNYCMAFGVMLQRAIRAGKVPQRHKVRICFRKGWRSVTCHGIRFSNGDVFYAPSGRMWSDSDRTRLLYGGNG